MNAGDNDLNARELCSDLQCDADALLQTSGLIPLLQRYGPVLIQGSYRYRLMTVPDIDLYVIGPYAGRPQAKEILCELIDQGFWNAFLFGDWVQFQHEGFPSGFYVGLKRTFRDRRWKVDIWNLVELPPDVPLFAEAMSSLTDEQRETILQIKHWRDIEARKIPSKLIYDAVLHGETHDVESFKRTIRGR